MAKVQFKRDYKANWVTFNPILADGEIGIEKDTHRFKLGDGLKKWSDLVYSSSTLSEDPVRFIEGLPLSDVEYDTNGFVKSMTYAEIYKVGFNYTNGVVSSVDYFDADGTTVLKTVTMTYNESRQLISHT
jgi:hypothetical protein